LHVFRKLAVINAKLILIIVIIIIENVTNISFICGRQGGLARRACPRRELSSAPMNRNVAGQSLVRVFGHLLNDFEDLLSRGKSLVQDLVRLSGWWIGRGLFIEQVKRLVEQLETLTPFYNHPGDTYEEAYARVIFLKDVIENKDGYRVFYLKGQPIPNEEQVQLLYRLTWMGSRSDVNREVNNGRGPVDFKISRGAKDKTLVEFKLASNSQLRRNLEKQVAIYEKASDAERSLKVIVYFSINELARVRKILRELKLQDDRSIILIDACKSNKPSASKA
jgi:hypothetical protein